jgi:septal ring factor EnvC (AmiA/AmiB activator)
MALGPDQIREFLRALAADPGAREELGRLLRDDQLAALRTSMEVGFAALTEAQTNTERQLANLTEAQAKTERQLDRLIQDNEQRFAALTEAQTNTERQLANLTEAQANTERELAALAQAVRTITTQLGDARGRVLESDYREKAPAY